MPYPINATHKLLLEDGVSYLLLEDNTSKIILDETVALDDPLNAATGVSTTPTLTFAGEQLINPVVVQQATGANNNANATTFTNPQVAGNTNVIIMEPATTGAFSGHVKDTAGNFYYLAFSSGFIEVWIADNIIGNVASNIVTADGVQKAGTIIMEISGLAREPFDSAAVATGTGTTAAATTTAIVTNPFLIAFAASTSTAATYSFTPTTPSTNATGLSGSSGLARAGFEVASANVSGAGSQATSMGISTSVAWNALALTLQPKSNLSYEVQLDTVNTFNSSNLLDRNSTLHPGFADDITGLGTDHLMLEDGTSFLLQEDGTSKILLNESFPQSDYVSFTVQPADFLVGGATYYWQVRIIYPGGAVSPWSATETFTTTRPTSDYSFGSYASLPTGNARLTTQYTPTQVTNVGNISNTTDVNDVSNLAYRIHQWASYQASPSQITLTYKGKAGQATSGRNAVLQVYNNVTPGWETLTTDSATAAGGTLNISGTINATYAPYFDSNNYIYFRVYQ